MTKEQMEIINKVVWFIPFRKKRDAIRNFLILLADRFNNIDNRFNNIDNRFNNIDNRFNNIDNRFNTDINQNQDLLTYMKNVNNVTVNYLFSLKKELAELKGNIQGKNRKTIYTCITNRYDNLFVHTYINNDWDYICFTDDKYLIDAKMYGNWIIKPLCNYDRGV